MIPAIIPFYLNREQLDRCLAHLSRQTCEIEVFVRDNSVDNVLFTAAINEGLLRYLDAPCEYLLLLNQDMYLEPQAVAELARFMDERPRCGIAAPLQLDSQRADYASFAGALEAFPFGQHVHGYVRNFREPQQVYWANGACLLLRKQMVREIGVLDPNLRFLGSDSDYCFTARSRDWEVWMVPSARGVHEGGASQRTQNPEIELQKTRDMLYFGNKWLNGQLYRSLACEGPALDAKRVAEVHLGLLEAERQWAEVAAAARGSAGSPG